MFGMYWSDDYEPGVIVLRRRSFVTGEELDMPAPNWENYVAGMQRTGTVPS